MMHETWEKKYLNTLLLTHSKEKTQFYRSSIRKFSYFEVILSFNLKNRKKVIAFSIRVDVIRV